MAQSTDPRAEKLWRMIKDIDVAMLTTLHDGHLRSRPMWTLKPERFDGTLYFFTRRSSGKMDEIAHDDQVGLSYSDTKSQNYVSISGRAHILPDRDRMRALWREPMRTFFPKGLDDPELALLCVTVEQADYWDSPSSAMVFLYGYAKAALTGTPPHPGDVQHLDMRAPPSTRPS